MADHRSKNRKEDEQRAALAWMKAQAKAIQPDILDDTAVFWLARIISSRIVVKKRRVRHRKQCTCQVSPIGYTKIVQLTLDKDCPFHKHYITKE